MNNEFLQQYGPWALVTGASSGIGEAFARALAAEGLNLIICGRRSEKLETLAAQLQQSHSIEIKPLTLDISGTEFMPRLIEAIGDLDLGLIVSNAGFGLKGAHVDQAPEALDSMLAVNARAPMLITQSLAPQLIRRGSGGIILTGSMEGYMGFPLSAAYSASKGFVHFLGEALWQELKPHNIDVLTLAPGSTDTEALSKQGFDKNKMSGVMSPDRVAHEALQKLGHKRIHMPGGSNRFFTWLLTSLPRKWGLAMAEAGMKAALKR
ncbi:MAG: SDR family NAD(P)-dependent oxidoreductase [Halioglobus sp.]